jgi:hypothetical protein
MRHDLEHINEQGRHKACRHHQDGNPGLELIAGTQHQHDTDEALSQLSAIAEQDYHYW